MAVFAFVVCCITGLKRSVMRRVAFSVIGNDKPQGKIKPPQGEPKTVYYYLFSFTHSAKTKIGKKIIVNIRYIVFFLLTQYHLFDISSIVFRSIPSALLVVVLRFVIAQPLLLHSSKSSSSVLLTCSAVRLSQ